MRRLLLAFVLAGVFGVAGSASALSFTSTFSFAIGALPAASFAGSGSGTSVHLGGGNNVAVGPGMTIAGTFSTPVTAAPPVSAITLTLNSNALISVTGTPLAGTGGVFGVAVVKGLGGATLFGVPFYLPGSPPGGLGIGGTFSTHTAGTGQLTVIFNPWQTGPYGFTGITTNTGTAHLMGSVPLTYPITNTVSVAGSDNRASDGGGTITLVSPTKIITNFAGSFPAPAFLSLTFVPEPGSLLLLVTGFGGLMIAGWRRSKRG